MIFGTEPVKIKYDGNYNVIDYSVARYNWNKSINIITSKDIFTGDIDNDFIASYSDFEVKVYLFKYNEFPIKVDKWNELKALEFVTVDEFYPHSDGNCVKDARSLSE